MVFFSPLVQPGVKYRDVGNIIQKHAQTNGCSVVRSYCGHGINQYVELASREERGRRKGEGEGEGGGEKEGGGGGGEREREGGEEEGEREKEI